MLLEKLNSSQYQVFFDKNSEMALFGRVFLNVLLIFTKNRHMIRQIGAAALGTVMLVSCVGSKKYKKIQDEYGVLSNKYAQLQSDLKSCEDDKMRLSGTLQSADNNLAALKQQIANLNEQIEYAKTTNTQVLGHLKDLSVISEKQAESMNKSLDKLGERDAYIKDLQGAMNRKDSLNMALIMNLKGALRDVNDSDIDVQVEKGVVFISISDKLLFATGKYEVNTAAKSVLGKVANVLNNQPNIEFMVEGHTDNVPYKIGADVKDNWDLSVLRATSIVRILQNDYKIDPKRMTAGGRGQYTPLQDNSTATGRAANRRTRIVILPELDQFFQLLEPNRKADLPAK
jgi:chemotaxis protein MotB